MTEIQAQELVERIPQEMPAVTAKLHKSGCGRFGQGYGVKVYLRSEHLIQTAHSLEEWESIRDAWNILLSDD